ncbi:hypothetical protein PMAYCL1PPCAC_13680, partial [Pristionchus mayeri]
AVETVGAVLAAAVIRALGVHAIGLIGAGWPTRNSHHTLVDILITVGAGRSGAAFACKRVEAVDTLRATYGIDTSIRVSDVVRTEVAFTVIRI